MDETCPLQIQSQIPIKIHYTTKNTNLDRIINTLSEAGFKFFCIFGGSLRDSDLKQKNKCEIKDYDIRIWSEKTEEMVCAQLTLRSSIGACTKIKCIGTANNRYVFSYDGMELDVSIRQIPSAKSNIEDCAKERVMNADIGLSAIAMSSTGSCWVHEEYIHDRDNDTLTLLKEKCIRTDEYMKRMMVKFPNNTVKQ